ncbi:uncharacterized protein BO96DRAFT_487988 [Aspergillus niger CBS 101883]|uniref:uncharacterized protein n=1 Tax=Aspergillus lacticoffeatus (strain CBS 101883) TaxID=1450533 RepID=UPI000D7ED88C|nr:uncharacterized protein BO96DRAFT_487988 [Aspergillus niger CBS 101883]PYH51392.1 hypothetical protein BO96DRAFT_487988 [Aspergillus niger CBS 101883]
MYGVKNITEKIKRPGGGFGLVPSGSAVTAGPGEGRRCVTTNQPTRSPGSETGGFVCVSALSVPRSRLLTVLSTSDR